jgi:outer membrane receptor protein involved in Fe transport
MMRRAIETGGFAVLILTVAPAHAAQRHDIHVPAGRLGDAAIALGRQTAGSIGMADPMLAALPVRALRGRMTLSVALDRLLAGTGGRAVRIDDHNWRIERIPAARRPPSRPLEPRPTPAVEGVAQDIVVTASKRATPLSRYAGSVEVVDGALLDGDGAASGTGALLSRISSLSSTHTGAGRNKLFIRAIADSGFTGPTQATTGQYLGDMRLNYAAPDPDLRLYDVSGIEVLEGPQGTLYGAGSLGGVIRITPNAPNLGTSGGRIDAGASITQHGDEGGDIAAMLNVPIVAERLAMRVVGYASHEGGYIDDTLRGLDNVNGVDVSGGRGGLRFAPDDRWTIDLSGLYQRIDNHDAQYANGDVGRLARQSPVRQNSLGHYLLVNGRVERRWGDLGLISSTGYVRNSLSERYDATPVLGTPGLLHQRDRTDMLSSETRLSRDLHDGLGWLVGTSYVHNRARIRRTLGPVGVALPATGVRNMLSEWTVFGEGSVQPIPALIVTAGARLTSSRLSGEALDPDQLLPQTELARAEAQAARHETTFLPSIALSSAVIPGLNLFLRYQQGFRPGGLAVDDYHIQRFRNDRVATVEAGLRSGVLGRSPVALSASIAHTDWKHIQADLTDRQGLPTTANIGDGRIYTLEARMTLTPAPGLTMDMTIIYNDGRLDRPAAFLRLLSFAGQSLSLPNVANVGGRAAVDYRATRDNGDRLIVSASGRYYGRSRLGVGPTLGQAQGNYVDTALSGSWSRGPLQLSLTLTNIFDAAGDRFALGTPFAIAGDDHTPMRPRTLRLGADFGF